MAWDLTRASAVRGRRLTAFFIYLLYFSFTFLTSSFCPFSSLFLDLYYTTHNTNIYALSGIRARDLYKRAATEDRAATGIALAVALCDDAHDSYVVVVVVMMISRY